MHRWLCLRDFRRHVVLKSFKTARLWPNAMKSAVRVLSLPSRHRWRKVKKRKRPAAFPVTGLFWCLYKKIRTKRWVLSGRNMSDVVLDPSAGVSPSWRMRRIKMTSFFEFSTWLYIHSAGIFMSASYPPKWCNYIFLNRDYTELMKN